jgi:hypothetical protein
MRMKKLNSQEGEKEDHENMKMKREGRKMLKNVRKSKK